MTSTPRRWIEIVTPRASHPMIAAQLRSIGAAAPGLLACSSMAGSDRLFRDEAVALHAGEGDELGDVVRFEPKWARLVTSVLVSAVVAFLARGGCAMVAEARLASVRAERTLDGATVRLSTATGRTARHYDL